MKKRRYALVMGLFILLAASCTKLALKSDWKNRPILIDGIGNDWQNALVYLENKNMSIGFRNDESFLYLCLITGDRDIQRRVMMSGFTVWFDPNGGTKKTMGIRYPLGIRDNGTSPRDMGMDMGGGESEFTGETLQALFLNAQNDMEILGPGKGEIRRLRPSEAYGIQIRFDITTGLFLYELKIPIASSDQYLLAIDAGPEREIGVGFEIPELTMGDMMDGRPGGSMRGGGMRGGGAGRGGGMRGGGGMGSNQFERPQPLKVWTTLQLASDSTGVSLFY